MAGISSKVAGRLENKKGFNGNEIQNKEFSDGSGLELYDFNARTYDQQTGRFIQIDPLCDEGGQESLSPYHFAENNPIRYNDPDGKCPLCIIPILVGLLLTSEPANPPSSLPPANRTQAATDNWNNALHNRDMQVVGSVFSGSSKLIINVIDNTYNKLKGPAENKSSSTTEPQNNQSSNQGSGLGRGKNNRKPDENATGDHSVSNDRGSTTYKKNDRNPSGFQEVKRVDTKGKPDNGISTPHVHENGKVRPAKPEDIPKSDLSKNKPPNQ